MSNIERGVWGKNWAYQCPDCGGIGQHAPSCGIFPLGVVDAGNRVAVVPAEQLRGAVEALREVARRSEGGRLGIEWVGLPAREALKAMGVELPTTRGQ